MKSIKKDGKYCNNEYVKMQINAKKAKGMLKDYLKKENTIPPFKIPKLDIDIEKFEQNDSLVWLGHSSILASLDKLTFIVDPMLSNRASPFKSIGPKRFEGSLTNLEKLPNIDVVLITHNHYDHMDKDTLLYLKDKVKKIFVPLDNAKILIKWGISKEKIKEFDWYDDIVFENVKFTFCPTQHFSGRGLSDRDKYLWGSWAVKSKEHSVYVSGDSGYNYHFKQISQNLGSFDIACMECGAYSQNWKEVHMLPEESVQASVDIQAKVMLPMHWASFDLSSHSWDEPISRALIKAQQLKVQTTTPIIGEVLNFDNLIRSHKWWQDIQKEEK